MSNWYHSAKNKYKTISLELDRLQSYEKLKQGGGPSRLVSVINMYLGISPTSFDTLCVYVHAGKTTDVHQAACSLKSSSANVGAKRLVELLQDLEEKTKPENKQKKFDPRSTLSAIEREFKQVCKDLEIVKYLATGKEVPETLAKKKAG